jgi:transcriptional regulator with XRE-family HTH domain
VFGHTAIVGNRPRPDNSRQGIETVGPTGYNWCVDFPRALKQRRTALRLSQLDVALRAGTTQRHLSFLESGRSAPGRELVLRLAESLDLPLRERNALLLTAGYAPVYPQSPLDSADLAPTMAALTHVLDAHQPYPALIVDRHGDVVAANAAFGRLLDGVPDRLRANAYRAALHPDGLAPRIVNLAEWARHILHNLAAALERGPDRRLAALHEELSGYVPDLTGTAGPLGFAVPLRLRGPRGELRLITTITSFATAVDVTLSELRLEAFLPADPATAAALVTPSPAASGRSG